MQIVNVDQKSPEWWKLKEKRMSASHAQAIAANGKGLVTYTREMMQEYYSIAEPDHFQNHHTKRGNDLEDSAAFVYAAETGNEVQKIGFVIHDEFSGCSPDLFVGHWGMAEIKARDDKEYFRLLTEETLKPEDIWQMQMQMMICEKEWCDFVAYNPNFAKIIFIKRVLPDLEKYKKLEIGLTAGAKMISAIENKMEIVFAA
jgi:exodeoxyribonuclease (lambda-induced)